MALLGHGLRPRLHHGDSRGPARPWGAGSGQGHCGCSLWWLHVPGRRGVCQSCAASAVSCRPQVRAEAPARSRGRRCPASGCSPRGRPHAPCPPASPGSLHQPPGPSAPLSLSRRCPERGGDGHRLGSTRARGQQEAPRVAPGRRSARLPPSRRVRVAEPARAPRPLRAASASAAVESFSACRGSRAASGILLRVGALGVVGARQVLIS